RTGGKIPPPLPIANPAPDGAELHSLPDSLMPGHGITLRLPLPQPVDLFLIGRLLAPSRRFAVATLARKGSIGPPVHLAPGSQGLHVPCTDLGVAPLDELARFLPTPRLLDGLTGGSVQDAGPWRGRTA